MKSSEESPLLSLGLSQPEPKDWVLDSELASPIPRRVVLRHGYIATAVLCAVLYLGLAVLIFRAEHVTFDWPFLIPLGVIALLYFAERPQRRLSRLLVSNGSATRGVVVELKYFDGFKGGHVEYVVAYHTPARRDIRVVADYCGFNVGDTTTVLYLPETPEKAMFYKECHYKAVASQKERSA